MRVVDVKDFGPFGFRWLTLKRIQWEDQEGRLRFWETAERTTRHGEVDGVAIIAKVLRSGQAPHIVIISQFRPPLSRHCLELPAGLVDAGEDAAQAALRELREETGYVGSVVEVLPPCDSDPGMTGANMQLAVLEVDGDAPASQGAGPHLEDGEFISTALVPLHGLLEYLLTTQREKGWAVDARLMAFAAGLQLGQEKVPPAEIAGFGSLLPEDLELGHAVEAALAAVAAEGGRGGGGSVGGVAGQDALAVTGAKLQPMKEGENGSALALLPEERRRGQRLLNGQAQGPGQQDRRGWWAAMWVGACSPQFGCGVAAGLAAGAMLWQHR